MDRDPIMWKVAREWVLSLVSIWRRFETGPDLMYPELVEYDEEAMREALSAADNQPLQEAAQSAH